MTKPVTDYGCAVGGPSCLDCQFSPTHCVYDLPMTNQAKALRLEAAWPLLEAGMTHDQVALHLGVDRRTIVRYVKTLPDYQPRGKPRKVPAETVAALLEPGMTHAAVARALGVGLRTADRYLGELRRERREAR